MKNLVQILCVGLAIVGLFSIWNINDCKCSDCGSEENVYVTDRDVIGIKEDEWLISYGDNSFTQPIGTADLRIGSKSWSSILNTRYVTISHKYIKEDFDYCTVEVRLKYDDIGDNVLYGEIGQEPCSFQYINQLKELSVGAYEAFYTLTYYKDDKVIKDYTVETVLVMDGRDFEYNGK